MNRLHPHLHRLRLICIGSALICIGSALILQDNLDDEIKEAKFNALLKAAAINAEVARLD